MFKKRIALLLAAVMLLSLAAACGNDVPEDPVTPQPPGPEATQPTQAPAVDPVVPAEKVYYDYLATEIATLNGQNETDPTVNTPLLWCSSALYRAVPSENGLGYEYIPDLASEMPEEVDDNTWIIRIRKEAKWHNGDPINADTFMFTWKTLLDPKLANSMATFLADSDITIVNATAYMMQGTEDYPDAVAWEDVGIKKLDDYTIEIKIESPVEEKAFCTHFTVRSIYPIHEATYLANLSDDGLTSSYGTSLDTWMGCGPYYFTKWEYDSIHVYEKNADHWLADYFKFDRAEFRIVPEMNPRLQLFESGKLYALDADADTIETYIDDPRLVSYPALGVCHYDINALNSTNPISGSWNYRKAIYHALNREVIAEEVMGYQIPSGTYINGQAGILSENGLTYRESKYGKEVEAMVEEWGPNGYSPELAREYLAKAYEECNVPEDTVITLKILYNDSSSDGKKLCEYLMSEFPKIFDGKIQCEANVVATGVQTEYKKDYLDMWDLYLTYWNRSLSRTLPYQCLYYFTSGYSAHSNNYLSDEYDAQFAACQEVKDADYETILQASQKMEQVYLETLVSVPIAQLVNYTLFSEQLDLPVETYIPGFGWGTMFADIKE